MVIIYIYVYNDKTSYIVLVFILTLQSYNLARTFFWKDYIVYIG